jgi:hypothetical protein
MLKKVFLAAVLSLVGLDLALAQAPPTVRMCFQNGASCPLVTASNPLPVNATVNASISPFTPSAAGARGTPIAVVTTAGGTSGTLPTGASVVVTNVGTTNPMYCNVNGVAATTSDQYIAPSGGWFNFGIPAAITTLNCISTGGTTTGNMVGGAGLGAGTGGGGGGGGGGSNASVSATGSAVPASATYVGMTVGGNLTGLVGTANGLSVVSGTAANFLATVIGPTADGSAATTAPVLIAGSTDGTGTGTVAIPKITAGGVVSTDISTVNAVTVLTGTGAVGTGAQRIAVGTDTATIAGSAPGTAGTPSANVLTVQGAASMTGLFVLSGTTPVVTMNSASANSGVNSALAAVFDDVTPTAITENSFGFLRMSANRNAYHTLRDAAGNERGQNVNANNAALIAVDQTTVGTTNGVAVAQIGANTVLTGNGVTGTGSQRVTIASDNTAFSVNATVTQATSSNLKAQVDPLTAASWGIGTTTQNSASATNGQMALGQFNTAPTTITTGNMSPLQLDNAGNLLVNIKAGAGSGGTAIADNATFTQSTTNETPMGCLFITTYAAATTGHSTIPQCNSFGNLLMAGASPASTAMQSAAVANGNGTNLTVTGYQTALVNVNCSVACSGGTTINFEGTDSVGTFFSVAAVPVAGTSGAVTTATTSGQFWVPVSGLTSLRARISAYSAGTITVTGTAIFGVNSALSQVVNANANVANNADAVAVSASLLNSPVVSYGYVFNGTTMDRMRSGTTTGSVLVNGAGTAGAASGGVLTVQGVASMTPILANPGTAANWGVGATGSAPPANSVYMGANESGATGGQMKGLINCDSHVFKHITSATDTLAVQGVTSQTIYVCAWRSRAAGVATWFLENTASTNANCGSANTQLTGVATEAANTGETWGGNFWSGLKNTSANGLCINSTGTGGVDVDIWYTQF